MGLSAAADDLFISVLVVGKVRRGVERLRRRDPDQAGVYEAWLSTVLSDYADRVLPVDPEAAEEWAARACRT